MSLCAVGVPAAWACFSSMQPNYKSCHDFSKFALGGGGTEDNLQISKRRPYSFTRKRHTPKAVDLRSRILRKAWCVILATSGVLLKRPHRRSRAAAHETAASLRLRGLSPCHESERLRRCASGFMRLRNITGKSRISRNRNAAETPYVIITGVILTPVISGGCCGYPHTPTSNYR